MNIDTRKLSIGLTVCAVALSVALGARYVPALSGLATAQDVPGSTPAATYTPTTTLLAAADAAASAAASGPSTSGASLGDAASPIAHILITEVMPGEAGKAKAEFVELYNADTHDVDLTGWSLRKKTSSGSLGSLVSVAHLKGVHISAGQYLLLASPAYTGGPTPDIIWAVSASLASKNNTVLLYDPKDDVIDTVSWGEIPAGESLSRNTSTASPFRLGSPTPGVSSKP